MEVYGLIGFPLTHSFSKKHFTEKFFIEKLDCVYENFEIESLAQITSIVTQTENLKGFNVTIPYKEKIIPYLTEIDATAIEVGAVNTVKVDRINGKLKLKGFNTDVWGFENSLVPFLKNKNVKALILGNGGASKAIVYVLNKLKIPFKVVSRSVSGNHLNYNDLNEKVIQEHLLIINTTPVGTLDDKNILPLPYFAITSKHICYDLIYNPTETHFLKMAKQQEASIKNGLEMLHLQAEKAWEIWQTIN